MNRKDSNSGDRTRIQSLIRDIPDFPKPGIVFKDITPLLGNAAAFNFTVNELCVLAEQADADVIVGIESRGFIFGAPVADRLGLPFVPIRKPGKLPYQVETVEYSLEYGVGKLDIHSDALAAGQRAVIVDDLLATGGTAAAGAQLVQQLGGVVVGFLFVIELAFLDGRKALEPFSVHSLLTY